MENGFVRHVVPVVETELQSPHLALVISDASQGSWTRLMALRSRPSQMRIPNFNAGPFRMSVVNMRTPHSRKHSHRHDQDSGNGHDHGHNHGHGKRHDHDQRQSSSRSPFATSFCFPTLVSTMKTARATATSTWQSGRRDVTEATSEGPPCVFAGANNLQPQCS